MIRDVHPGSGSWFFTHPGIPNPDPQHFKRPALCDLTSRFITLRVGGAVCQFVKGGLDVIVCRSEQGFHPREKKKHRKLLYHSDKPVELWSAENAAMYVLKLWIKLSDLSGLCIMLLLVCFFVQHQRILTKFLRISVVDCGIIYFGICLSNRNWWYPKV